MTGSVFELLRRAGEGSLGGAELDSPMVETLERHGVAPWVADVAQRSPEVRYLGAAHSRLEAAYQAQVGRGLRHQQLTGRVVEALTSAGVGPVVLLKGYGLAQRLFANPMVRVSSDVDVLVPPSAVERAAAALGLLGLGEVALEDAEHHHRSFARRSQLVELHHGLFTGFGRARWDDGLWRRIVRAELDGREVAYLSPEDEFLYLAAHAANHAFLRLSWLVDLERYLRVLPPLDWQLMHWRARDLGVAGAFEVTKALLAEGLGVAVPGLRSWRGRLGRRLFSDERLVKAPAAQSRWVSFGLRLSLVDGASGVAQHLLDGARRARLRGRPTG